MRPNKSTKKKYTDKEYDYESLYDTPINQLEEKEIESLLKTNSIEQTKAAILTLYLEDTLCKKE